LAASRPNRLFVYIDLTRLICLALRGRRPTGIDRVELAYLAHFRQKARALVRVAGRWVIFKEADSQHLFDWVTSPNVRSSALISWMVGKNYVFQWQRPQQGSMLLNTGHNGLDSPEYAKRVRFYNLLPLYFLHDLIPIKYPEFVRPGDAERHQRRLLTLLMTARGVIVNSAATGLELEAHAMRLGVALPPCVQAHLSPPNFPLPNPHRPSVETYFVVLGTIEPRKNHLLLLNLWRNLREKLGVGVPHLVVIGQRGWECEHVVDMLDRCEALNGFVHEISDCDDAALATWLYHAQALLLPSFAEGYGIPLVEALSLGTPVIASDLPVFRELAGDIPEYLDPLDALGWRQAVLDYSAAGASRRAAQKVRMQAWQTPTWAAHFAYVDNFIANLPD
jgi:glycosyltransferase involved in cell wall biosynthesis